MNQKEILPPQMRKIVISDQKVVHNFSFRLFASRWFRSWLPWVSILDLLDDDAIGCPWVIALSRSCHNHDIRTSCGISTTGWPNITSRMPTTTVWLFRDWCCIWNLKWKNYSYWIVGAYYIKKVNQIPYLHNWNDYFLTTYHLENVLIYPL